MSKMQAKVECYYQFLIKNKKNLTQRSDFSFSPKKLRKEDHQMKN